MMKYTILSWAILAFTNVLAAVEDIPNKYMVVHNVNVVFRKSKRDIDTIAFSLYNVASATHFACTSTRMPYHPMTPDFESCKYLPQKNLKQKENEIEISFGVEPPTVRLTEDGKLDHQLSMLLKYKDPRNGDIWFARYRSNEDTNELMEFNDYYVLKPKAEVIEEYSGSSYFKAFENETSKDVS